MHGRALLTLVVVLVTLTAAGHGIAQAWSGCEVNWTAENRAAHSGCTAGPISAGTVSYAGGTLWRHHNAPYTKGSNSDKDCRKNADCTFTDFAEDSFTCSWNIQCYENGQWVNVATISGNCSGANWDTAPDATHYEPGKEYRAKCGTNDTSGDGPYGDDAVKYRYSAGQMLWAPTLTNFQNTVANCPGGGVLHLEYEWDSSCGHLAHLDKVTVREKVTYEPAYTAGGFHDLSHDDANCFTSVWTDPTYGGDIPGTGGAMQDNHAMPTMGGTWASYCQGAQVYQWATGWPYRPSRFDDDADWQDLASYAIRRYVENVGGWRYRITKGAWECEHDL
ncbi:MAG: hypothetical protein JSV79_12855 [Armatimonadota bacterium]|nr:MAG: hypothetical protein JSV79_12855 [Armatimonadota bacterium]